MAAQFRKKPVVIEAMRIDPSTARDATSLSANDRAIASISGWMLGHGFGEFSVRAGARPFGLHIHTLEGDMVAAPGDWVIRGVQGEFYSCKPEIFEATYEAVEDATPAMPTFWNGMPAPARRGSAVVADAPEFPGYWARELIGQRIEVVEVNLAGVSFSGGIDYLDNRDGSGWRKVTEGRGGPGFGHSGLDIEVGSFIALGDQS